MPMSKGKIHLVVDKGKALIAELFPDEEARLLSLADIALHNSPVENTPPLAGSRAKDDHRKLMQELQREAEKISKRAA